MKYLLSACLLLSACSFHPLYENHVADGVCITAIPEATGYQLKQALEKHFPQTSDCRYTLKATTPSVKISDQSISNSNFITMQRVSASSSYKLFDSNKKVVLTNTASTDGSSAVVTNPYSTVVSVEKTIQNLVPILANQISLHVTSYLDREQQ